MSGRTLPSEALPRFRWVVCALLFVATTLNYVDRQVLGILAKTLQREFGWSDAAYGGIVASFQTTYAIGLLLAGRLLDRIGLRWGYAAAVVVWSLAGMGHALAGSAVGFGIARAALGLGEAANFPAAVKSVAQWFPPRERALATGIFNSGSNLGALLVPLLVPAIVLAWGWRAAFIVTGAVGLLWPLAWWWSYRHPAARALATDSADGAPPAPGWRALLRQRRTWALLAGRFMTDPIWWFLLYWMPKFLEERFGVSLLAGLTLPLVVIYLVADVGSIGGGWLSSRMIARGRRVDASRKLAMLACAGCTLPVVLAPLSPSLWFSVAVVALAAAAHQGWAANLFTLVSDCFPQRSVATVVGMAGTAGAIGGVLFSLAVGWFLHLSGGWYLPLFVVGGCAYLAALLVIHLLLPRFAPVEEPRGQA